MKSKTLEKIMPSIASKESAEKQAKLTAEINAEKQQRAAACKEEVSKVLEKFNCVQVPQITMTAGNQNQWSIIFAAK